MVIITGTAPLTVVFPLPAAPMTLWQELGCNFNKRGSCAVRTQSWQLGSTHARLCWARNVGVERCEDIQSLHRR